MGQSNIATYHSPTIRTNILGRLNESVPLRCKVRSERYRPAALTRSARALDAVVSALVLSAQSSTCCGKLCEGWLLVRCVWSCLDFVEILATCLPKTCELQNLACWCCNLNFEVPGRNRKVAALHLFKGQRYRMRPYICVVTGFYMAIQSCALRGGALGFKG